MMDGTEQIPAPPGLPFVGNLANIDTEYPVQSMIHLAEKYGESDCLSSG